MLALFSSAAVTLLLATTAAAQTGVTAAGASTAGLSSAQRAQPKSLRMAVKSPPRVVLDPLAPALFEESSVPVVGSVEPPPVSLAAAGRCDILADGTRIWRVAVDLPESGGVRFHFAGFHVRAGQLWVHSGTPDEPQSFGPYTGSGPLGDGDFWSAAIFGEQAVIEYQPAADEACTAPFYIPETGRIAKHAFTGKLRAVAEAGRNHAASCHLDVSCYPAYADVARSVGRFTFIQGGQMKLCTGVLVATKPATGKPYFLTANHCVPDAAVARTVEVYWFYDTPFCSGTPPAMSSLTYRSAGVGLLAGRPFEEGDFSLLEITSVAAIPNLRYAGWTTIEPAAGAQVIGIHHPGNSGDHKRVSMGHRISDLDTELDTGQVGGADLYYRVQWDQGRTEPGSSGSPLFVFDVPSNQWVVAGVLSSGPAKTPLSVCDVNPFVAGYSRFGTAYPDVKPFLNGDACSVALSSYSRTASYGGIASSFNITAGQGCPRPVQSNASWIAVTSGQSGTGPATVQYSVAPNPDATPRTGTITVSDQTHTVRQTASPQCPAVAIAPGQILRGTLGPGSCRSSQLGDPHYAQRYTFTGTAGQTVAVSAASNAFDAYVYLFDANGRIVAQNDDGGFGTNARIPAGTGYTQLPASGTYDIEVTTYDPGQTGSYALSLTAPAPQPANDEPGGAIAIPSLPFTHLLDTTSATTSASDPSHSCTDAGTDSRSVWYRFVPQFTGSVRIDTTNSDYDTVIAVYADGNEVVCSDDPQEGVFAAVAKLEATAGRTYLIQVSSYGVSQGGALVLEVSSSLCTYSLSAAGTTVAAQGTTGAVAVQTAAGCGWTAASNAPWLQVFPLSGVGSANLNYTVFPSFGTLPRSATLMAGGRPFTVDQSGAAGTANERFVSLVYFAYLGRLPSAAEIAFQVSALNSGATREQLAANFFQSAEFNAAGRFVAGLYVGIMGRDPEYGGWLFQRNALASGATTANTMVAGFMASPEYQSRYGNPSDAEFIRLTYRYILLREATQSEVDWQLQNTLQRGTTRVQFVTMMLGSREFQVGTGPRLTAFLLYATLLQRDPAPAEFVQRAEQVRTGTPVVQIMGSIMGSTEFQSLLQ